MQIQTCVALLLLVNIYEIESQNFIIGVLDQDVLNALLQNSVNPNFTVQLVTLPTLNVAANYESATTILDGFDVIIGRFNYAVASICQQTNLTYFYLDNIVQTFPGALLELNNDLVMEAQMLLIYLTKYNINFPIRLVTDGSEETLTFRYGLGEISGSQCIFNSNATSVTVNQCYNSVFQGSVKSNYIFMTGPNTSSTLDMYLQQSLYMSLPFTSIFLFPMSDIVPVLSKYSYSGGFLLEVSPETNVAISNYTLIQRNGILDLNQIVRALSPYTKVNSTSWIRNNVTTPFNKTAILTLIKAANNAYQPNGRKTVKQYQILAVSSTTTIVSALIYSGSWTEIPYSPNPVFSGSRGYITALYFVDTVFINEVNTISGITVQGYSVDLLNYLFPPIQLYPYISKFPTVTYIGLLQNGSFNAMLGLMNSGFYTITAFPVPIITSYRSMLTYSDKIADIQYSMLILKAVKTVDYFKLAKPYSPMVWITILATIVVLSIILFLTNLISPNISTSLDNLTINNSTFMVFGSLLIAKMLVKPNMFSTQIFYVLIWLGTLLLIASYVAILMVTTAFLNTTKIQFTTYQSLWDQKNYQWTFVNNSYLYNSIQLDIINGQYTLYRNMYDWAFKNWPDKYLIDPSNVTAFAFNNSNFGVLNDNIHNLKISLQNCSLTTVVDTSNTVSLAFVINPNFPYYQDFSKQLINIRATGILDILATKYFQTGICPTKNVQAVAINGFGYEDTAGIFILMAIGIILSLIIAGIEYLLGKGNLQCQRVVTGNSLQFGKIYKAKVKALDKNGVTVDIGRQSIFSRKNDARIYYVPKNCLGNRNKNNKNAPSPTEQGIMIGTTLTLKYLGNNPDDSKRKFVQIMKK